MSYRPMSVLFHVEHSKLAFGPEGTRTPYLFHAMEALYQMSYRPKSKLRIISWELTICPRRELNPYLTLRTGLLYPLSYRGMQCSTWNIIVPGYFNKTEEILTDDFETN
jgi:hypothetical protein